MVKKITFLLTIIFVLAACSGEKNINTSENQAPPFELKDLDGNSHSLADYKGKKVYIKFWASWCPICLAGLEEVNTLSAENTDFVVLTVVAPGYNNEKKSVAFTTWFKGVDDVENVTVLLDEGGIITKDYQVRGYPTSVFIDSKGELVYKQPGHLNNEQIKEQFNQMQ